MTKSLTCYPEEKRKAIAERRLKSGGFGTGYWAARDYYTKKKLGLPGEAGVMQSIGRIFSGCDPKNQGRTKPTSSQYPAKLTGDGQRKKFKPNVAHKNTMKEGKLR